MRVLIVTGMLAEEAVNRYASEAGPDVEVMVLPVSVAAFITPMFAAEMMKARRVEGYDLILMPGAVRGDVSPVESATGIPTFKGPLHAADLPLVLGLLEEVELSKTVPASELVRDAIRSGAMAEVEEVDRNWRGVLEERGGMTIGRGSRVVPVGRAFPMRVVAEIVNAPVLDVEAVKRRALYYEAEGADIIDIGMLAGRPMPGEIRGIIDAVRASVDLPVSIDTLEPSEIEAAVDGGVDLVLSVDSGNMEEVASAVSDIPVVVLPSNMREGSMPRRAEERVAALVDNIERAKDLGLDKVIADPVLEPPLHPGLMESLRAYQLFRQLDAETPVLFGLGNVTELIDVDSTGVNGLLAALASEVGADLLFTPEFSAKARGSVRELAAASRMMFLARRKRMVPKDLGLDLLVLKEKRWREEPYDRGVEKRAEVVEAERDAELVEDRAGWFKIEIDRERRLIAAAHFTYDGENPDVIVKGRGAREVYMTIINRGLVSKLDHAAYLGRELVKAEMALRLGRSYVEDEDLFA
ncbi:MAG: dihydropteroate synthase-like protein [Candidatus Bathyarchaeota archaeon]|nr:dihydropteroate synthase-like protein [Candidatus Bathyarchaeota archaeon]